MKHSLQKNRAAKGSDRGEGFSFALLQDEAKRCSFFSFFSQELKWYIYSSLLFVIFVLWDYIYEAFTFSWKQILYLLFFSCFVARCLSHSDQTADPTLLLLVFYTEGGTRGAVWDGFHGVFLRDTIRIGLLSTSCAKLACSHSHSVPQPPLFSLFTSVLSFLLSFL